MTEIPRPQVGAESAPLAGRGRRTRTSRSHDRPRHPRLLGGLQRDETVRPAVHPRSGAARSRSSTLEGSAAPKDSRLVSR